MNYHAIKMMSPTGMGTRKVDKWGSGAYGASRGKKWHHGIDFICKPGNPVYAPVDAKIARISRPYAEDNRFSGVLLRAKHMVIQMFYMAPYHNLVGGLVDQGTAIGKAQDISIKYPEITPHIHLQIKWVNPGLFF